MLNDFTGGGQIFLHKLRMFFQVLHRSFMTSLLISLAIVGFISYKPAQILDLKAAMTYQKALLADGFDEASRGIRQTINRFKRQSKSIPPMSCSRKSLKPTQNFYCLLIPTGQLHSMI